MIRLSVKKLIPEHIELFRDWMSELDGPRRLEALATLKDAGCTHEIALVVEGIDGPIVIYAMEVEDVDKSPNAAAHSIHPIYHDHRTVMDMAIGDSPPLELLLDLHF